MVKERLWTVVKTRPQLWDVLCWGTVRRRNRSSRIARLVYLREEVEPSYPWTCGLQYMGKTSQPLHVRINGHLSDITHRRTDVSPVAEHFNGGAHSVSDLMVMVIELSPSCDPCLQKVKEGRWIRTLETSSHSRINIFHTSQSSKLYACIISICDC